VSQTLKTTITNQLES